MSEYHKILSVFKRDQATERLIDGDYTLPEFKYLANNKWVFTEKVDGTNIRVTFQPGETVSYQSRSENALIPAKLIARLNERFLQYSDRFEENVVVLYGEGYGPNIQKRGENYRENQDFVLFDVRFGSWWLERHNVESIAESMCLDVVPIIGTGTLPEAVNLVKAGIKSTWGDFAAEGIVARPEVSLFARNGSRIITKIKCKDFS